MESTHEFIMSQKSRIIDALTLCLKQKSDKNFKLNKSAAYTGLTDLYEHYALENKHVAH